MFCNLFKKDKKIKLVKQKMKCSEININSLKKDEGIPLLNFEEGPEVALLNFEGGPGVPLSNLREVPGQTFKL